MAMLMRQPSASACTMALLDENELLISTAILAEAPFVNRRKVGSEMRRIIKEFGF